MPEFVYAGQVPRSYSELRDEDGELVGPVEHGDTRKLAQAPPDGFWFPGGTKIAPPWPADDSSPDEDDEAEPAAETASPAPPAGRVISSTAAMAGQSGEE